MSYPTKKEEWKCPKCGSDDCEMYDYDFDWGLFVKKMSCYTCGHTWREYFITRYDGYTDETGEYNEDGDRIESYLNEDNESEEEE